MGRFDCICRQEIKLLYTTGEKLGTIKSNWVIITINDNWSIMDYAYDLLFELGVKFIMLILFYIYSLYALVGGGDQWMITS